MELMNQTSDCNQSSSEDLRQYLPILITATASLSLTACVVVEGLFMCQRLYHRFAHRLIIYLLLYAVFISFALALRVTSSISEFVTSEAYTPFCAFSGFLAEYSGFTLLLSQTVLVIHTGCVVVLVELRCTRPLGLHYLSITSAFESESSTRNAKRYAVYLELIYALSPAVLPLLFVWVPFITGDYGKAGLWCWIRRVNDNCELVISGVIQQYTLWYGPLLLLTLINTCVIITTIIIICWKAYQFKKSGETPTDYKNTLKQVLPILTYPVIFQIQSWFALANRLNGLVSSRNLPLLIIHSIGSPSWGLLASITSIVYFVVWKRKHDRKRSREVSYLPPLREDEIIAESTISSKL